MSPAKEVAKELQTSEERAASKSKLNDGVSKASPFKQQRFLIRAMESKTPIIEFVTTESGKLAVLYHDNNSEVLLVEKLIPC